MASKKAAIAIPKTKAEKNADKPKQFIGTITDIHAADGSGIADIEGAPTWYHTTPATRGVKIGQQGTFEKQGYYWNLVKIPTPDPPKVPVPPTGNIPQLPDAQFNDISNPAARSSGGAPSSYSKAWTDAQDQYMGTTLRGKLVELINVVNDHSTAIQNINPKVNTVVDRVVGVSETVTGVRDALQSEAIVKTTKDVSIPLAPSTDMTKFSSWGEPAQTAISRSLNFRVQWMIELRAALAEAAALKGTTAPPALGAIPLHDPTDLSWSAAAQMINNFDLWAEGRFSGWQTSINALRANQSLPAASFPSFVGWHNTGDFVGSANGLSASLSVSNRVLSTYGTLITEPIRKINGRR